MTKITAHSGAENHPQNSVEYIEFALASQADGLEIDIRRVGDRLLLTHDESSDAPDIGELFSRMKGTEKYVNCDCKTPGLSGKIIDTAVRYGVELHKLVFSGAVGDSELAYINDSGAFVYLNADLDGVDGLADFLEKCKKYRTGINVNYRELTDEALAMIDSSGVKLTLWTVDNPDSQRKFIAHGVDTVTTNKPIAAVAIRNEI